MSGNVILSCFDWLNNEDCNYLISGDQVGNIYFIQILSDQCNYRIAKYYNNAHTGMILDVKFFQQGN